MSESTPRYTANKTEWDRIAETREFKDLLALKKTFIIPAFVFFLVYYFLLPILVGYAPEFMSTRVIGVVNLAYLFALSQFFMAWIDRLAIRQSGQQFRQAREGHHQGSRRPSSEPAGAPIMSTPLVMFLIFIAITVGITYWASKRSAGSSAYFAASRRVPDGRMALPSPATT